MKRTLISIFLLFAACACIICPASAEIEISDVNLSGTNKITLYNVAIDLATAGEYEEALETINAAIEKDDTFALAYSAKAGILNAMGEYEEAVAAADKAIELRPDQAEGYINKGNALLMLGRYEESIEASGKAIELDPEYIEAYVNKGTALGYLGRYEEELEVSDEALEIDPSNNLVWANKRYAQKMIENEQNPQGTPVMPALIVISIAAAFLIAKRK